MIADLLLLVVHSAPQSILWIMHKMYEFEYSLNNLCTSITGLAANLQCCFSIFFKKTLVSDNRLLRIFVYIGCSVFNNFGSAAAPVRKQLRDAHHNFLWRASFWKLWTLELAINKHIAVGTLEGDRCYWNTIACVWQAWHNYKIIAFHTMGNCNLEQCYCSSKVVCSRHF